jgi:hypothetical protein
LIDGGSEFSGQRFLVSEETSVSLGDGLENAFQNVINSTEILALMENLIKGTAFPLQAWTGPEGSRSLRIPAFKKSAHEVCRPYAPAAFTPQEILLVLISVRG